MKPSIKHYSGMIAAVMILSSVLAPWAHAQQESPDMRRFFYSGDGTIKLYSERTGKSFSGAYRSGPGGYDQEALDRIRQVFGAPRGPLGMGLSLRLVERIDYLEDHLQRGGTVTITSGYRAPEYNAMLREQGSLAADASLHQYGMAADLRISGVKAETLWNYVRHHKLGGAGYYHGDTVHVDVGPARSWDETTSGVGTGISSSNKLIGIIADYDIYRPGMPIALRFIRMTGFPIRVASAFSLIRQTGPNEAEKCLAFIPALNVPQNEHCAEFNDLLAMQQLTWELPPDLEPGRYRIQADFCGDDWPEMPRQIQTPEFHVTRQ